MERNIYKIGKELFITSDEEIKEGDWVIAIEGIWKNTITKITGTPITDVWRKIILTTDQDLIKDGVQAIPDEFLKWFVKNPSCEFVNIITSLNTETRKISYEIIIPKEESKQETLEEFAIQKRNELGLKGTIDGFIAGAKWHAEQLYKDDAIQTLEKGLALLLKKQERMYSEEDMIRFASLYTNININKSHLEYFNNLPKSKKK